MAFTVRSAGKIYWLKGPVCWLVNMLDRAMFCQRWEMRGGNNISRYHQWLAHCTPVTLTDLTVFLGSRVPCLVWICRCVGWLQSHYTDLSLSLIFATADTVSQQHGKSNMLTWLTQIRSTSSLHITSQSSYRQAKPHPSPFHYSGCWISE